MKKLEKRKKPEKGKNTDIFLIFISSDFNIVSINPEWSLLLNILLIRFAYLFDMSIQCKKNFEFD